MNSHVTAGLPIAGDPPGIPERPLLSVIVPCHGHAAGVLREQLAALAAQELDVPWELLIADNGASPATLATAAEAGAGLAVRAGRHLAGRAGERGSAPRL